MSGDVDKKDVAVLLLALAVKEFGENNVLELPDHKMQPPISVKVQQADLVARLVLVEGEESQKLWDEISHVGDEELDEIPISN
jgi:hypothetical protein